MNIGTQSNPSELYGLGDILATALSSAGVTHERVERWLGKGCGCRERQQKLNILGFWAKRVIMGKVEEAKEFLDKILSE